MNNADMPAMPQEVVGHTKTPWHVAENGTDIDAVDQKPPGTPDWCVATVDGGLRPGVAEANAAYIVRCVNSHERLVEALRDMVELDDCSSPRMYIAAKEGAISLLAELDKEPSK